MDTESVYRQLREQIVAGAYRPGDRLPEVSLSTALGVSRTPVREALRRLESDGLVQASGRGVTVTAMSTRIYGTPTPSGERLTRWPPSWRRTVSGPG